MKSVKSVLRYIMLVASFVAMVGFGSVLSDPCGAGFDACEQSASTAGEIRACITGYFACEAELNSVENNE
jgi:hypothetical protein